MENGGDVAVSLEGIKLVDKDSKNTFAFPKGAELNAREKLTQNVLCCWRTTRRRVGQIGSTRERSWR